MPSMACAWKISVAVRALFQVVHWKNVWMLKLCRDARFVHKALHTRAIGGDSGIEHLDGDVALQIQIARRKGLRRAAAPEHLAAFVASLSAAA